MIYLLDSQVRNKENLGEMYSILAYIFEMDIITYEVANEKIRLIERLKEIGEDIVYDMLKDDLELYRNMYKNPIT